MPMKLPIDAITEADDVLPRGVGSRKTVAEYAADLEDGVEFPHPVVFFDGETRWLADGRRRLAAYRKIGALEVVCDVRKGSKAEATFYAAGANRSHGVRLTALERRRAVENVISSNDKLSDRHIAEHVRISRDTVAMIRKAIEGEAEPPKSSASGPEAPEPTKAGGKRKRRIGKDGIERVVPESRPVKDAAGHLVPEWALPIWQDKRTIERYLSAIGTHVVKPAEEDFAKFESNAAFLVEPSEIAKLVQSVRDYVQKNLPHVVCIDCAQQDGRQDACERCFGKGWLTRDEHVRGAK